MNKIASIYTDCQEYLEKTAAGFIKSRNKLLKRNFISEKFPASEQEINFYKGLNTMVATKFDRPIQLPNNMQLARSNYRRHLEDRAHKKTLTDEHMYNNQDSIRMMIDPEEIRESKEYDPGFKTLKSWIRDDIKKRRSARLLGGNSVFPQLR